MNVLKKIVIPRLNVTNAYILMELEEIAREEFSRLKKVKEKKKRDKDERENTDQLQDINNIPALKLENRDIKDNGMDSKSKTMENSEKNNISQNASSSRVSSAGAILEEKLIEVRNYFEEITMQAKELIKHGDNTMDTSNFLEKYEKAKQIISQLLDRTNYKKFDKLIDDKLEYLKSYVRDVANITENYDNKTDVSKSKNDNNKPNVNINNDVDYSKKENESDNKQSNVELQEFKDIVLGVEKITSAYIKQGLLSPSMEKFVQSCNEVTQRLNKYNDKQSTHDKSNESMYKLAEDTSNGTSSTKKLDTQNNIENKNHSHIKLNVDEIINLIDNLNVDGNIDSLAKTTANIDHIKQTIEEECDCSEDVESKSLHDGENAQYTQLESTSTESLKYTNFHNIPCRKICKKVCFMCSHSVEDDKHKQSRCEICKNIIKSKTILKNDEFKVKTSEETQTYK